MTADGTPTPRTGETITTAAELDALPDGSVVRDIDAVLGSRTIGSTTSGWMLAGFERVVSSEFVIEQAEGPLTVLFRPDAPQRVPADDAVLTRAAVERMLAEQSEMDRAMHEAYRPEVVAEVAVHLSEETDWDAVATWCGGTVRTGQEPSGEYVSDMHIPGVGTAWQGAWIVQRHDGTFAIRAEVEGPSEASIAALIAARATRPATTDDAVERVVSRMEISARGHRESAAQSEDQGDMDGYSASTDAADILDRHIRDLHAALAATSEPNKAPALCEPAQGRDLVRERLATAEELRQDIGRISARSADGVTTSALAVALADAGWVKVPLAETSEGR